MQPPPVRAEVGPVGYAPEMMIGTYSRHLAGLQIRNPVEGEVKDDCKVLLLKIGKVISTYKYLKIKRKYYFSLGIN